MWCSGRSRDAGHSPFGVGVFPVMNQRAAAASRCSPTLIVAPKVSPAQDADEKRTPKHITTVEGELFQVKGEETLYDDPCDAIRRARKLGAGAVVIRISDRKVIAEVPGYIPPPPKEWG